MEKMIKPDFLFETSWEICNKVGGIHTVISTKALTLVNELNKNYILIGPDVWRDSQENPEFEEDRFLFRSWQAQAREEGLHVKIGRWKIQGAPIVIIVDFQSFTLQKDEIFAGFWETYKLDSLTGQWDYVEPALFGYAAAKVIESFVRYYAGQRDRIIAQFHEWMTGTGILYLKKNVPQVGTVFTTHATVLGRSIAGNQLPLYEKMEQYNPETKAAEFNIQAKQSLEKLSALHADAFATVSNITAKECAFFLSKDVDLVTPNGFEDSFVPSQDRFSQARQVARDRLMQVSRAVLGTISEDPCFVATSGRYEFRNKGIDVFIKSLGHLKRNATLEREVIACILIPANHYGPRKDLQAVLAGQGKNENGIILTHNLHDQEYDPVLNLICNEGLNNEPESKVKVLFVPCYLNGDDGIFNLSYYDLLIGFDLTAFPSYYEPWGYTPMESVAFHIPTITTSLAGFGLWVKDHGAMSGEAVRVIERNDNNDLAVIEEMAGSIRSFAALDQMQQDQARKKAFEISRIALWENFIQYYRKAFHVALGKSDARIQQLVVRETAEVIPNIASRKAETTPKWRRLLVESNIPSELASLQELSRNLWWSWNYEAAELFESIDPKAWSKAGKCPILLLENLPYDKLKSLASDQDFMSRLAEVYRNFRQYIQEEPAMAVPSVGYFSMEYGLHASLKIYSGGLGVLAGDYLKEASDMNIRMTGVGLLYRYGYFTQVISPGGDQINHYELQDFTKIPVQPVYKEDGSWSTISIVLPGRTLYARIWKAQVGRIPLYLLDTDYEDNTEQDRSITHQLYGGNEETRLKQEMLLGVGGIRALRQLGVRPDVYHCNEGHAAFIGLERLFEYIDRDKLSFSESLELVRASTLFTTHTPVPAGHDSFEEGLMRMYLSHYPARLRISWQQFMGLGRIHESDAQERFSMSYLAANLSQEINGVSKLHGQVSRNIFSGLWPGYLPEELHVGYVTNGVHYPTWTAPEWRQLYETRFGEGFLKEQIDPDHWSKVFDIPDREIWNLKNIQRSRLFAMLQKRLSKVVKKRRDDPKYLVELQEHLNDKVLTIGFARRFATYKRAHLLFKDLHRLSEIVNHPEMPVQFLFAGKAHPADKAGQDLIKMISNIARRPEFVGKILFLENYDMDLATSLIQGVDIWMNTPTRPLEASGTSGEKVVMNGGLHFSVLDGWWYEGYQPDAGWALKAEATYQDSDLQDELDARTIYALLENEITPAFYERNAEGVPEVWVSYIKNSIAKVASRYTTTRMLSDYIRQYYIPQSSRFHEMHSDDFAVAKRLSRWKKHILNTWDDIELLHIRVHSKVPHGVIKLGNVYTVDIVLDMKDLNPEEIGVEFVAVNQVEADQDLRIVKVQPFELQSSDNGRTLYRAEITTDRTGAFDYGFRVFPIHPDLPHRQDFPLIKWL